MAARREYLTPRHVFGPSELVYTNVSRTSEGWYLLSAPHLAAGEPVHAVGWARNDYWAVRVWGTAGNDFHNDHDPLAGGTAAPSLEPLGWPHPLTYAATLAAAKARSGPVMVSAGYRFTDGSFRSHQIHAGERMRFHFDDPNPDGAATAVAFELGLGGRPWDEHLAAVKEINEQNRRRGIV